jgi:hypothetical protein
MFLLSRALDKGFPANETELRFNIDGSAAIGTKHLLASLNFLGI